MMSFVLAVPIVFIRLWESKPNILGHDYRLMYVIRTKRVSSKVRYNNHAAHRGLADWHH